MNKRIFIKVQKVICIFFIGISCFSMFGVNVYGADDDNPPKFIEKNDGGNWITAKDSSGISHKAFVTFSYQFQRTSYNKKEGKAYYNVGEYFSINYDSTLIYSDKLYIDNAYYGGETYIGTWSENNGWKSPGVYRRNKWYPIVLNEGVNVLITRGEKGTGGNTKIVVIVPTFREYTVTFKDWDGTKIKEETVESGYCPTYPSDPSRHGYAFTGWDTECGEDGITKDTTITAKYEANKYNVNYHGNGATSGSTTNQTADYDQWFHLSNNGFVRQYTVNYNGNGGAPTKTSDLANATFKGWLDDNPFDGYQSHTFNAPYYAHRNPDVLGAFGYNKEALFNHWRDGTLNGTESRTSSPYFNLVEYMQIGGSDLVYSFGNDRGAYANHWNIHGYHEGRKGISTIDTTTSKSYPNQAYVKNFSYVNNTNVDLKADWQLASVQLPNGTRSGYKLIYWKNGNGQNVGKPNETYTPQTDETLIAVWDKAPTITATDKTFYEGEYTSTQWQNTIRWQGVSAIDQEDGNITSKVKVVSDNVNVNKQGTYKVVYSVTDSVGQTSTATSTVTVKYNNPPTIKAEDRWFYVSEDVNETRLKEYVIAQDIEDGVYKDKARIKIIANNVQNHVIGDYKVTYKITDNFGKSAQTTANIHIVKDIPTGDEYTAHLRFISKKHINTLKSNSIWRTSGFAELLNGSLNKTQHTQAREHWHLTAEDIKRIQNFNDQHDWSQASNQQFLAEFGDLLK